MAMLINLNDTGTFKDLYSDFKVYKYILELFRMLASRAIESADPTKYTSEATEAQKIKPDDDGSIFKKISKSLKNISWYKSVTDLNGTMIAPKSETNMSNKRER